MLEFLWFRLLLLISLSTHLLVTCFSLFPFFFIKRENHYDQITMEWDYLAPAFWSRILGFELDFGLGLGLGLELGLGSGLELEFGTNDSLRTANIRRQNVPYPFTVAILVQPSC